MSTADTRVRVAATEIGKLSLSVESEATRAHSAHPPRNKIGFLDLPAEIRNKIYMHMDLPIKKGIEVRSRTGMAVGWPHEFSCGPRPRVVIPGRVRSTVYTRQGRGPAVAEAYNLDILLACKRVNREVTKIIFGNNHFMFMNDYALFGFKAITRSNFAYLRDITLEWLRPSALHAKAMRELAALMDPASIKMYYEYLIDDQDMWNILQPFVTRRATWRENSAGGRFRMETLVRGVEDQEKRLDAIEFVGCEDLHEILHPEVVDLWERQIERVAGEVLETKSKAKGVSSPEDKEALPKASKVVSS